MINVRAGVRLVIAATNVADVKAKLSAYKLWLNDPLKSKIINCK